MNKNRSKAIKVRCCRCKKEIIPGNRPDGIPNGVGFQLENGKILNFCAECIIKEGMKRDN